MGSFKIDLEIHTLKDVEKACVMTYENADVDPIAGAISGFAVGTFSKTIAFLIGSSIVLLQVRTLIQRYS